jgi:hypothetical protein
MSDWRTALVAAAVSAAIAAVGVIVNIMLHGRRITFEGDLAKKKFDFDMALARECSTRLPPTAKGCRTWRRRSWRDSMR